jgi:outer membrane biosynthesis protein TonB
MMGMSRAGTNATPLPAVTRTATVETTVIVTVTPTPEPTPEAPPEVIIEEPPAPAIVEEPVADIPEVEPEPVPEVVVEPEPQPEPASFDQPAADVYYKNCAAARAAGADPVYIGEPGYGRHLDRDGDGVGCE